MKHGAKDGKSNMFGIGLTVIFHVALLFIGIGSGLKYNYPPPEEQAILMEFISDEQPKPIEVAAGIEPRAIVPRPDEEVTLVQRSEGPVEGTKSNEALEATVGDVGDVEVPEPPRKEINRRALFPTASNDKKDTLAPQTADTPSDNLTAGHAQGNTRVGSTDGTPSARLSGRSVMGSLPLPEYSVQASGRVVVRIMVDKNGNVTSAVPGATGTTVTNRVLWEAAKEAALKAKFNTSSTISQEGTITYIITLK
jgi:TonB family protein